MATAASISRYRQVSGPQLAQNEIGAGDVAVVDVARNEAEPVALRHGADLDLERDQRGLHDQAPQQFE